VLLALTLGLVLFSLEVAGGLKIRQSYDRRQFVGSVRLAGAFQTFRPSERSGLSKPVGPVDLAADRSVRTEPPRCAPLTLLAVSTPLDGQSWTGINGSPAQPVTILTVRYADAGMARADLRAKRLALLRCHTVRLTFPPFDQPAQTFTVHARNRLLATVSDHVSYDLTGAQRYEFYVRQYANTLTWTYGDDVSTPSVRHQVADSLIGRLRELNQP
jgi:hypothetical protein